MLGLPSAWAMRLGQEVIRLNRNIRRSPEYGCRSDFRKTANVCHMRHNAVVKIIPNCIKLNGGKQIEMEKYIGRTANGAQRLKSDISFQNGQGAKYHIDVVIGDPTFDSYYAREIANPRSTI